MISVIEFIAWLIAMLWNNLDGLPLSYESTAVGSGSTSDLGQTNTLEGVK